MTDENYATRVFSHALAEPLLSCVQDEADALSECPNFWVPRDVIDGAIFLTATPAEAAVAHLHELVHDSLPHDWSGAEYWVQVYHGGRGLAFHMDKDEHAMKEQGAIINPCLSSVLYLTGDEDGPVQSATVVTNQRFDHETGRMAPSDPTTSTLVFPRANTYCVFDGRLGHGVLDCGHDGRRVTFLINWWKKKPQNIDRAEPQITGEHHRIKREGTSPPHIECILPEVIEIEKSVVPEDGIIMMDDVFSHHGILLRGDETKQAVTVKHDGLSLYPIENEQLHQNADIVVGAAVVHVAPTSEEESSED